MVRLRNKAILTGLLQAVALYLAYLAISLAEPWGYAPPWVQAVVYGILFIVMMTCIMRGLMGKIIWPLRASLRAIVLSIFLFAAAAVFAGPDRGRLIEIAVKPRAVFSYPVPEITMIVTPPAYSGREKFTEVLSLDEAQTGGLTPIPQGSEIMVRVLNIAHAPTLIAGDQPVAFLRGQAGGFAVKFIVDDEISWAIKEGSRKIGGKKIGGRKIGEWPLLILADETPVIERADFRDMMSDDGLFGLSLHLKDDHGLAAVYVDIVASDEAQKHNIQNNIPNRITLPITDLKEYEAETYVNFSSSDLVSGTVDLMLEVVDQAGQSRKKIISGISLPEKKFANPHARKIIEIREQLLTLPDQRKKLARRLMALGLVPGDGQTPPVFYMALRSAYWRLTKPKDDGDIISARDILWDIAMMMEDGDVGQFNRTILDDLAALKLAIFQKRTDDEIRQQLQDIDKSIILFQRHQKSALRAAPDMGRHEDKYDIKELRRLYGKILSHMHYKKFEQAIELVTFLEHGFIYQGRDMLSAQSYGRFQVISSARDTINNLEDSQRRLLSYVYKQSITLEIAALDMTPLNITDGLAMPEQTHQIMSPNKNIKDWIALQKKLAVTVSDMGIRLQRAGIDAAHLTVATGDLMRDVTHSMEAGDMAATAESQTAILMLLNNLKKLLDRKIHFGSKKLQPK